MTASFFIGASETAETNPHSGDGQTLDQPATQTSSSACLPAHIQPRVLLASLSDQAGIQVDEKQEETSLENYLESLD